MGMTINTADIASAQYESCEKIVRGYNPNANTEKLRDAFAFAAECHAGQLRKDGTPYITHPLATAAIAAELRLDDETLIAALLHDCIEDTDATYDDIAKKFGKSVANIVDGVTKLKHFDWSDKEAEQKENLQKLFRAMAIDLRVVLVKIADRLHNMRTMEYQSEQKRKEKSRETMEVYAPLAYGLGLQEIKRQLEDLSMRYLEPEKFAEISRGVVARRAAYAEFIEKTERMLREHLEREGFDCEVDGREKHIYSIYRKMCTQNKTFHEILDLYAFRVVLNSENSGLCYSVLGAVHDMFRSTDRFKDYISTPKPNGYRSLHTTVYSGCGFPPFEVQIRTREMHEKAEKGIAAHWRYKPVGGDKFAWIGRLIEAHRDSDKDEFVTALNTDIFADEVFVITPRGDVKFLPVGSTPVDFAYAVHSQVGNHMTGAIVNERVVPYSHKLVNGDIVEIITSKSSKGPSRDWLNIIKTTEARNKIRQWFKLEKRDENIVHGRATFESELKRAGLSISDIPSDDMAKLLKKMSFPTPEDLFAAIGYGGASAQNCVNRIRESVKARRAAAGKDVQSSGDAQTSGDAKNTKDAKSHHHARHAKDTKPLHAEKPGKTKPGVIVEGMENCLVKFARCCAPIPGDPIVGFVTRGYGVAVHHVECRNYLNSRGDPDESGRWVNVAWADAAGANKYSASLRIMSHHTDDVVLHVANVISAMKVHMVTIHARDIPAGSAVSVAVRVHDNGELAALMNRLRGIDGVYEVARGCSAPGTRGARAGRVGGKLS